MKYHAAATQPAPDECFCDRMYPDSNPNASCGDCPTRDYGAQPVAWIGTMPNGLRYAHLVEPTAEEGYKEIVPLYAHPQTPIKPRHALGLNELLGGEYDQ